MPRESFVGFGGGSGGGAKALAQELAGAPANRKVKGNGGWRAQIPAKVEAFFAALVGVDLKLVNISRLAELQPAATAPAPTTTSRVFPQKPQRPSCRLTLRAAAVSGESTGGVVRLRRWQADAVSMEPLRLRASARLRPSNLARLSLAQQRIPFSRPPKQT